MTNRARIDDTTRWLKRDRGEGMLILDCSSRRALRGVFSVRFGLIPVLAFGMLSAGKLCAAVYARIEASFAITNLATDTFDYTQTDVRVQIVKPDSTTVSLPAFFDGGVTWRA